jgi:RNA polymerase II subunit A C-terminal domain phosphatase SSU72
MNRSMEAHNVLAKNDFQVSSFGTGNQVRLPGPNPEKPNVYAFGTPYDLIYNELAEKDLSLYSQNGVLQMLNRNRKLKTCPMKFQGTAEEFDLIITCEEKCFDAVCEEIASRAASKLSNRILHVVNFEIKDNHEDACTGAQEILKLVQRLEEVEDLHAELESILEEFQAQTFLSILHSVLFY